MPIAQGRVAQLDLAPNLAAFASRSVISTPPRFARDYSADARIAVFVETHRLRTFDAEHDQGVSRKPSLHAIRESRIASSPREKIIDSTASRILAPSGCPSISSRPPHFDSFAPADSGIRAAHSAALGAGSELVGGGKRGQVSPHFLNRSARGGSVFRWIVGLGRNCG